MTDRVGDGPASPLRIAPASPLRIAPASPLRIAMASPLRIAMVCPYSLSRPGGVQGQVVGLARVLSERGHLVTVFAPVDDLHRTRTGIGLSASVELVAAGRTVSVPANGSRSPVCISPRAAARARSTLRHRQFEIVHVHEPFAPGLTYALLAARDIPPLVATFHRSGSSIFYSAFGPLVRRVARHLAIRCAVSPAARDTAHRALGGEYEELFNGVETEGYQGIDPWPTTGPTVLFLGRHEPRKGLRVLLDAWRLMSSDRDRDLGDGRGDGDASAGPVLWIAGDGPETTSLRRSNPQSPTVRWLGVLTDEEKRRRLVAADVLCAPSLGGESFGMVLVEAMAARTVVVASDIDGYREVADGNAVLVPPGNAPALARTLASELSVVGTTDSPLASAQARRVQAAAVRADQWSMERLGARYEALYRSVTARPTP